MCCLFGLLDYDHVLTQKQKTRILSVLSIECEDRGVDATGFGYVSKGQIRIYKKAVPAHKMHFTVPKDSQYIMGHTRLTTQGDAVFPFNNHPFRGNCQTGAFALAHNGMLWNDLDLREREHLPNTKIQTDSYILVQLLEKYQHLNCETLKKTAEMIRGSFTFTVLDQANQLYIVKGDNPFCLYQFNGFYLYASTEEILKRALLRLKMDKLPFQSIPLLCGDILKIDHLGRITQSVFDTAQFVRSRYVPWHPPAVEYFPADEEEAQELLEYAGHFGVAPEDITMLLDFGYDLDTIEDLLYHPSMLQSCLEECAEMLFC